MDKYIVEGSVKAVEFERLTDMLTQAGIPFQIAKGRDLVNLKVPDQNHPRISVSFGQMTYGYRVGLLESWTLKRRDSPRGFQTAEEAYGTILSIVGKGDAL